MTPLDFGLSLLRMHLGARRAQLALRAEDHGRPYLGRKVPVSVTLSCTHRCNLHCAHCQAENDPRAKEIPTDRFLRLIDEIADTGCSRVGFTGGEPLMRPDFGEIVERCVRRGLMVSSVCNGWLVKRNIEKLKGIRLLFLSLDGDREAHDRVRGPGSFDKFAEAAEAALGAGIPVAALTTLMSHNASAVRGMAEIVEKLGLHWLVGVIQTGFTGREEQGLTPEQTAEAVRVAAGCRNLRSSRKYLRFVLGREAMRRCYAGVGYAVVGPDGRLYPCFPAIFDHPGYRGTASCAGRGDPGVPAYESVDLADRPFTQAFAELPLYRRTCATCTLACHAETNFLYEFSPECILQSFRMLRPA